MKSISLSVVEDDYEAFRRAARESDRSIAHLIREAMALYRAEELERREPLRDVPVLPGHRSRAGLPSRAEIYEEIYTVDG